ncbi:MAG: TetR/AcrR family transcriptional regulator [Leptospira sp.]|nr:TetR/AcrR family transcriptional regulator [Leptospira sp.]
MPKILSPQVRILNTAKILFYRQGYHTTGINQILKESRTAKASFYDHYPSKEILGKKVIRQYSAEVQLWFRKIMNMSDTPFSFVENLARAIETQIKSKDSIYQGCPIAIFSCQFPIDEPVFSEEFTRSIRRWETMFIHFWQRENIRSVMRSNVDQLNLSRDLINLYEGSLMNWRISKDRSYIDRMKINYYERIKLELKK